MVHADQAVPYDPAMPPAQMSLIGCGGMTGVGAALYAADVQPARARPSLAVVVLVIV
ncbi:MAG: hypothetical protein R2932_57395 [Caldilineaceae bacterium]